ncbi:MAG: PDZ domain-containing protein [Verrucomicrobia bacterium]|nr:PDZ domain-containing protein [Verrucomicrobiota bacterium]
MKRAIILLALAVFATGTQEAWAASPSKKPQPAPPPPDPATMTQAELARATPLREGFVRRRQVGLNTQQRPDGKMEVVVITKGRGAEKAGVQIGDIVVAIGGWPIKKRIDLLDSVRNRKVGEFIPLTLIRNGAQMDLNVELGFTDIEEPIYALYRLLYEEKKVGLAVMGAEINNVLITDRVALEQWAKGVKSNLIAKWESRCLKAMSREKEFSLVDRQSVEQIMKELNFGQSGMVSENFRATIGKTLGATHLLTLEFARFRDTDVEKQRLIEIETGKVLVSSMRSTKR